MDYNRTSAELLVECADGKKEPVELTTWSDAPEGKIEKYDTLSDVVMVEEE